MTTANRDLWSLKRQRLEHSPEYRFFRKNLAPRVKVGDANYSFIVYLTFTYRPVGPRSHPLLEDEEALVAIEEVGFRDVEADGLAVHVASVSQPDVKDFLFYTRNPELFLSRAQQFRDSCPQFEVSCEIAPDPKWEHYKDFP